MSGALHPVEEEIIRYVKNNPGCSKSDIVRFIKGKEMMGRPAVLLHIDKLEREKMIICELERPNSQIYKVKINHDNKLASTLGNLEEFKKAYSNLLKKSKERIDNKDYSEAAKLLNLKENDPVKWEDDDKARFSRMEKEKFAENAKTHLEFATWYDRSVNTRTMTGFKQADKRILEMEEKLRSETDAKQKNRIMLEMNKFLSNVESDVTEASLILDNMIQTLNDVKNYEVEFLLDYAVFIYYWFVEIMTFYTILVWSDNKDKRTFSNIYSIIFGTVSEMQSQLLELFRNNKLSYESYSPMAMIAYFIKVIRDNNLKPSYLYQYYALDMKSEIKSVANSLLRLNEEIKKYNLIDMGDFESIGFADRILEVDKARKVFLEWIEKSKNTTKIDLDSPEFQHQSEMAMQAVKKIIQLQIQK